MEEDLPLPSLLDLKNEASICHIKAGLFEDQEGNKVYFEGSGNETISGTMKNAENYLVSCSFLSDEQKADVDYGEDKFERIWNNTYSDTVKTEFPFGKLYEILKSFSKGRTFNSQDELFQHENCVYIDINQDLGIIELSDFTSNHWLRNPRVLRTYYSGQWNELNEDHYVIHKLTLHDLRDKITTYLSMFGIKYILSDAASFFIENNDLELSKRFNLGLAIKQNQKKELWENEYVDFTYAVNNEMVARLKPKQMHSAFFHYEMVSSADFSVPGTGKTYISYGLYAYLSSEHAKHKCDHLVVFGPINCFKAWKEEGTSIFGYKRSLSIFDVQQHKSDFYDVLQKERFDVYLFNYDFLGTDNENTAKKLELLTKEVLDEKTMLVFDEIHKLKSLGGVTANNFIRLLNLCKRKPIYRLALTGTPLPNSFVDILNYLKILYTEDVESTFSKLTPSSLKNADQNPILADKIIETLLPVFVRTTKKDLEVPPPDPDDLSTLSVTPTPEEQRLYKLIWQSCSNPLLKYIRLIQASSNPALLKERIIWSEFDSWYDDDDRELEPEQLSDDNLGIKSDEIMSIADKIDVASKTQATLDLIGRLVSQGKKVLVWCLFVNTIDFVTNHFKQKGIKAESIYGIDSPQERNEKLNGFKFGDMQILVTNPNTLAESVSLHMVCHDAIYLEYGFNLTYMLQSKDRINRVGITPDIHTHYYFAISDCGSSLTGSIDRLILDRLNLKSERMLATIESGKLCVIGNNEKEIDDINYILSKGSFRR